MSARRIAHIAYFQAGAFAALYATSKSKEVLRVTLGGLVFEDEAATEDAIWRLGGAIEVTLAAMGSLFTGLAAEARYDDSRDPYAEMPAEEREEAATSIAKLDADNPTLSHDQWLAETAEAIVDEHWTGIVALAKRVEALGSVHVDEAELLLEAAKGFEPARSAMRIRRARAVTIPDLESAPSSSGV